MVSCTLVSPRLHSISPSSSCIPILTGGVTKTRTSIYEVSFPLEETMGNQYFASLFMVSFILVAIFVEQMRSKCSFVIISLCGITCLII